MLRDDLVYKARKEEMEYVAAKKVWVKVSKGRAKQRTGRAPISVRWVDVNKGDDLNPNYRSRLVARQLKARDTSGETFFAPAPPLEALRTVVSMAMTKTSNNTPDWDPASSNRTQISLIDVKRAYFNAKVDQQRNPCFVSLPNEDPDHEHMCGELLKHMYGTRAAADGWQEEYSTTLIDLGFTQGLANPNIFYHRGRCIYCSVHGDDFTSSGPKPSLDWMEEVIGQKYENSQIGPWC